MKIIILHGLYMHGLVMQPLSLRLKKLGYQTQTLTYNTVNIDEVKSFSIHRQSTQHYDGECVSWP